MVWQRWQVLWYCVDGRYKWYCLFNNVLDIHMPFKTRRVKIQHQPEWFSASISSAIKQRNNLHRQAVRYNTELHWQEYRLARNQVVHVIRKAKRDFYRNSINCNLDTSSTIQWFASYLSDRFQCTNFKGTLSDPLPVSICVPQGSILGPLFLLLFINDLPLFLPQNTTLTMFADDTSITQFSSTIKCSP